jgi:Putative zinc-finger
MQHLDEGTIHAWLDGELSPAEAEAAEAHVATCDECKAAVAEARGFIAGSSRILLALDAVPGGVLPASTSPTATKARAPKRFVISRAWMAAAAVLVLSSVTVIAIRPRGNTAALRVAEAGKEQKASAMAPIAANTIADSGPIVATAPVAPSEKSEANAPAPNAPAPKPADALEERLQKSTDKGLARAAPARKDAPVLDSDRAPMMVADAARAREEESSTLSAQKRSAPAASSAPQSAGAMAAEAAPVARPAAPMVAQAPAPAPPRYGDSATARPLALNSVVVTGAGIATPNAKLDATIASDSIAPQLVSRSTSSAGGDTIVTTVYSVHGVPVSLIDRSAGHVEIRLQEHFTYSGQAAAKARDATPRVNSLTWSDSTGRSRTLRGAVSQAELEQLKAALFGPTP